MSPRHAIPAVLSLAALLAWAASPAVAPRATRVLWSSGAETGGLSAWSEDGGGGVYNSGTGTVRVTRSPVRSGARAFAATVTRAEPGNGSQATRLFRWRTASGDPLPVDAHYGAWLYLPRRVRPAEYWNVFQWKTKISADRVEPTFVVGVDARPSGRMYLWLWDAIARRDRGRARIDLPVGRWVHLEARYRWSNVRTGRVVVWQDGRRILSVSGVRTALPSRDPSRRSWSIDNYTNGITPSRATIFVDDASISLGRVGPRWRARR